MRGGRESQDAGIGISAVIGKLYDGDSRRADVEMRAKHRIWDSDKAGEEGETEALMSKESHALVAMVDYLVLTVGYSLISEGRNKLVRAVLYTLDACGVILVLELLGLKYRMLVPALSERKHLGCMEKLLHLGSKE